MKEEQEKILPYEALESLGINKKDLKASDTEALLAGNKTELMKFSVEDTKERRTVLDKEKVEYTSENGKLNFEGKVQLQKYMTVDNTEENKNILKGAKIDFEELQGNKLKLDSNAMRKVAIGLAVLVSPVTALALVLVPKRTEIKNDLGLTEKDIKDLKKGEAVGHTNAKGERLLVQLDKDTNNLVSVRSNDISIPNKIAGQEITPIQKEQLKNGQEIQVKDSTGQTVFAKIDLNEKTGLSLKDENGQKITVTPERKTDISANVKMTDTERLYIVSKIGIAGVDYIHPENLNLRENFLQKYNLSNEVNNYNTLSIQRKEAMQSGDLNTARSGLDSMNTSHENIKNIANAELERLDSGMKNNPIREDIALTTMKGNYDIKLVTDTEKLQYVSINGFDGVYQHNDSKNTFDKAFMDKYNLSKDYDNAHKLNLRVWDGNTGVERGERLESLNMHSNNMKETAKNELTKLDKQEKQQTPEIKLTNDKERLQHIANNGIDGIKDIHPTNTKLRDEFFEKHNLSKEVKRVEEISKLSPEEYNKQGKGLNKEMDSLSNSLKSKASGELSGLERGNSVKSEVKQETTSFKMKM